MPSLSKDVTAPAARVKATVVIPVENQMLIAACVMDVENALAPNDAYVVIGLMEGGDTHQNKITELGSGYVGASSMVSWWGVVPLAVDTFVFADIYSSAGGEFRLTVLPWKMVLGEGGELVVKP